MAYILTSISKSGGDLAEVRFRFCANQTTKPFLSTGIHVLRDLWNDSRHELKTTIKAVPNDKQRKENIAINKRLSDLRNHLLTEYQADEQKLQCYDVPKLREWLLVTTDKHLHPAKYEPKGERLKTLFDIVNDAIQQLDDKGEINGSDPLAPGTIITYKQCRNYLAGYALHKAQEAQKGKGKKDEVKPRDWQTDELDTDFYNDFQAWLYAQGLKRNTAGKQVKVLKSILRKCMPSKQQASCEFLAQRKCPVTRDKATDINAVALNEQQLAVMAAYPFTGTKKRVRDQFLLMCWTGQRFSDLPKLNHDNIHTDAKGMRYFLIEQQKTGQMCAIPILDEVAPILAQYGDQMPKVMSNQKFNAALHDICQILANTKQGKAAGYNDQVTHTHNAGKLVTTEAFWDAVTAHSARRTFCTVAYDRHVPVSQIMQVSGHQSQTVFFDYIRKPQQEMHERMADEFATAWSSRNNK